MGLGWDRPQILDGLGFILKIDWSGALALLIDVLIVSTDAFEFQLVVDFNALADSPKIVYALSVASG